jgi:hypothetical protein
MRQSRKEVSYDKPADRVQTQVVEKDEETKTKEADARRHFERTGSYRAEDVISVLGDPRERVEIKSRDGVRVASWTDEL